MPLNVPECPIQDSAQDSATAADRGPPSSPLTVLPV
jgi:hypothetical protein